MMSPAEFIVTLGLLSVLPLLAALIVINWGEWR